jgi:beta-N-acetylhexosaminidase
MAGFSGMTASADIKRMIRDFGVSSVVLFARNVDGPEQVADLVRELQGIARDAGHELPLAVAVDQEGGRVARLREPWTIWPTARTVGRTGSVALSRQMGAAMGRELAACGIHWDFAPVVDVDSNPRNPVIGDRSFGADPAAVGRFAAAFIGGLQGAGVAACAKHFPGHGDTEVDSHLELPVVDHSPARLDELELPPFRAAVAADVASVMTAHVLVRELDDSLPATLSTGIVGDLLRRRLAFEGVVVSDDLEMKAITLRWEAGMAATLAAQAGCDLLLVCHKAEAQAAAVEALVRATERDELSWTAMDAACGRLKRLKETYALPHGDPDPKGARLAAASLEGRLVAERILIQGGVPS